MASPPRAVAEISEVLGSNPIDLKRLGEVAQRHPAAASQIIKVCNTSTFSLSCPVSSLEQATVSLGAALLRAVTLAWGLIEQVGRCLPAAQAQLFWQHSLTTALVSERIAAWTGYPLTEAYLAGFLHDIGRVPLLMVSGPPEAAAGTGASRCGESTAAEANDFGIDHCELGRQIGMGWGFPEPFIEVFALHHASSAEANAPELLNIVGTAESLCSRRVPAFGGAAVNPRYGANRHELAVGSAADPDLAAGASLVEILELEFLQTAQSLKLGDSVSFAQSFAG